MGRRAGRVILVAAVVVSASVLAAANVPDPTWVGGLYDGADGDELLALVWDQSAAVPFDVVSVARPAPAPASPLQQGPPPAGERSRPRPPRAPPLA